MPINRLFWKFFIYLWLAQFATISVTNAYFWYRYSQMNSEYQVQQLAAAVQGSEAHDGKQQTAAALTPDSNSDHRQLQSEAPRKPRSIFPTKPMIIGTFASAIFAWLLAWSFSRPITQLRNALNLAAKGNLDVRIGESMRRRNDELGDLGIEFDRMSSQLQQLLSSQQTLLHDVSHEMRSPLARMQAIIGLIDQQPEQSTQLIEKLNRETQRIDKLVSEILTVARLDTGLMQPEQQLINVEELLLTLIEDTSTEATVNSIQLSYTLSDVGEINVPGDGDMLYRAIDNLLRNAIKFTPAGGSIYIEAKANNKEQLEIVIADTGPGIAAEDLSLVTSPFFRSQHAKPVTGYGLGLSIAERIIKAHRGSLNLQANTPKGLRAVIALPLSL